MTKYQNSILINRPLDEVFAVLSNAENDSKWKSGGVEFKKTSQGPIGVDSTWNSVVHVLGQRIESQMKCTEHEAGWKYTVRSQSERFPYENQMTFEQVAGLTQVSMRSEAELGGFIKLAEPLLTNLVKRQFQDDLANLKDMLEAKAF